MSLFSYFIDFLQVAVGSVAFYLSLYALRHYRQNGLFRSVMYLIASTGFVMVASAAVAVLPDSIKEFVRLAKTGVTILALANVNRHLIKK